jgi:hypothetical protein
MAIAAPRGRAVRVQRHKIKEQIMTTPQNPPRTRPLPLTKTPRRSDRAATANKPSGTELSDDVLDHVAGGLDNWPPEPPDPCIK